MASISVRTGSEGPHYDPYHFTEICFTRTDGIQVVLHSGLAEWCEVSDQKHFRGSDYLYLLHLRRRIPKLSKLRAEFKEAYQLFEEATGMDPKKAEQLAYRLENPTRCKKCGRKKMKWEPGYPGEYLLLCEKCHNINSSGFNESEII